MLIVTKNNITFFPCLNLARLNSKIWPMIKVTRWPWPELRWECCIAFELSRRQEHFGTYLMCLSQINQVTSKNIIDQSRPGAGVDQSVGLVGSFKFRIFSRQIGEKVARPSAPLEISSVEFFMVTTGHLKPAKHWLHIHFETNKHS